MSDEGGEGQDVSIHPVSVHPVLSTRWIWRCLQIFAKSPEHNKSDLIPKLLPF